MRFRQILAVKETREGEGRVALTPKATALLVSKNYRVLIETDAGLHAGFNNINYIDAGAEIFSLTPSGFPTDTFIVRVKRANKETELLENEYFHKTIGMLGFLSPFAPDDHVADWQASGITTLSFDVFKNLSIDDPKNALAAMSRIAGRLAFKDALTRYKGNQPIKLTVIGTGPAAFSAAFEAVSDGIPVQVFGRKAHHRATLEAAGIIYHVIPNTEQQTNFIRPYLTEETIIITAARTEGEKAPLLIDEESLCALPCNAVVVDLAVNEGGNVIGSKSDQIIIVENKVLIINISGYPKIEPRSSSEAYAQCVVSLLTEIMTPEGNISFENELVKESWVTHDGQRNISLYEDFEESNRHAIRL